MIELRRAVCAVAEKTGADAFPIARTHWERIASGCEMATVDAVSKLVSILMAVVRDAQIEFLKTARLDDLTTTVNLNEDTIRTKTDSTELLAGATQTRITLAVGGEECRTLANVTNNLLREHIAARFQTVGRQDV